MFEHFTEKAVRAVINGQEEARACGREFVSSEEILIGLVVEDNCQLRVLSSFSVKTTVLLPEA